MLGVLVRLVIKGFHLLVILELCAALTFYLILSLIILLFHLNVYTRDSFVSDVPTRDCRIALNAYSGLQAAGPSLPLAITTATWLSTTASLMPQKDAKMRRLGKVWGLL